MNPSEVSAVLVTRGDQDLSEIVDSIEAAGIDDIVIWNNAERENLGCYGRFIAIAIADVKNEFIYTQDDDLVAPVAGILARVDNYWDRNAIVANNRIDEEWPLIGIGSVFHRDLADCFDEYEALFDDADLERVCDVVFAYQWPYRRLVLGYRDLPWGDAWGASMYLEPGHMAARELARERTLMLMNEQVLA